METKNFFKGILLDLDDTLYDYESVNLLATQTVIEKISTDFNLKVEEVKEKYYLARQEINSELKETGSSHSRFLYIQRLIEKIAPLHFIRTLDYYSLFTNTYLKSLEPSEGVIELFEYFNQQNCKVAIVTDLTAEFQFQKMDTLGFQRYTHSIITSEEAGVEKPHPWIFSLALKKLNLLPTEVCMIGDSYKKDILGAHLSGIFPYWLNKKKEQVKEKVSCIEIHSIKALLERWIHGEK